MHPTRLSKRIGILALAVAVPWTLRAQEEANTPAPAVEAPSSAEVSPTVQESDSVPALGANDKIPFLDYQQTDLRTIITEVAELYELNVVIPDTLIGTTSLKLRNVTWRQVFEIVLGQVDFTFSESNGIVRIISRASLAAEPVKTEVVVLNFAKASDIQAIVSPMLVAPSERVQTDTRTNSLILTIGQSKSAEVLALVNRLDNEPGDAKQVLIDTKFVEANLNDVKNIGVNWASLNNYQLKAGPFSRTYESTANQQVGDTNNSGTTSNSQFGNTTNSQNSGTSAGSSSPSGFTQNNTSSSDITNVVERLAEVSGTTAIDRATTAVFSAGEFNVILSALKSQTAVRLMSNPTVVSLTNEEAKINVTTKFPIILSTSTPGASGNQITETKQDEEYGISLKVVPQIRPQGLISLSITPEVSNLDGFNTGSSGNRYPIISRRSVTNRVNLRDGYTIALGGLVQSQKRNESTKVPFLGDLPGLGRLFQSKSDAIDSRNLIVFITARVIDSSGNTREPATQGNFDVLLQDTVDPRMIRTMGIERFDLPGFRPEMGTFPTEEEQQLLEEARKKDEGEKPARRRAVRNK